MRTGGVRTMAVCMGGIMSMSVAVAVAMRVRDAEVGRVGVD